MSEKSKNVTDAHCNKCLGTRRHETLHMETASWADEEVGISGGDKYEMLRCLGCEYVTVRHSHWFSEDTDESGNTIVHREYWPPAISRKEPEWLSEFTLFGDAVSTFIGETIKEVYVALHSNSRRLAAMGVRSILEHLIVSKVGDHGSFTRNLDEFEKAGHIASKQKTFIATLLEAGHATIHREYNPSPQDLKTLLDITETTIETVLIHESEAKALAARIPPRNKKP